MHLLSVHADNVMTRAAAIALLDSVHCRPPTPALQHFARARIRNWVTSSQPLDSNTPKPWVRNGFAGGCSCRSAGELQHTMVPFAAMDSVFEFLVVALHAPESLN